MSKIEIAVAYHKNSYLFENECLLPLQVGRACSDIELNMQGDDTGDNISEKNFGYAELTAIYWLWKNSKADIKGLFHYRRFLDLNPNSIHRKQNSYEVPISEQFISSQFIDDLMISKENIRSLLEDYKILTRRRDDMRTCSVRSHFTQLHPHEHLDKALEIIRRDWPEYSSTAEEVLDGTKSYFTNMLVMNSEEYNKYCTWLFDILFKIESTINLYDRELAPNTKKSRWAGFLGERLTSIYIQKQNNYGKHIGEFPCAILTVSNKKYKDCDTFDNYVYNTESVKENVVIENKENSSNPIISVCISAYNAEKYITKCLTSVCDQTLSNIEIIVVNDGSTDGTLGAIKTIANRDSRIQVIDQENGGPGKARNVAIRASKGKYIHLMDSDDYMDRQFLEHMVRNAEKYHSEIVVSTHRGVNEDASKTLYVYALPHTLLKDGINIYNNEDLFFVGRPLWDKIFVRDLICDICFTSHGGEDIYFWFSVLLKAKNISIHRNCEYNYRVNPKSIQQNPEYVISSFTNIKRTEKMIDDTGNDRFVCYFSVYKRVLVAHMINRARKILELDCDFRKKFYSLIKMTLDDQVIPDDILMKNTWYVCDFDFVDRIRRCSDLKEFEKLLGIYSPQELLWSIVRYTVRKFVSFPKESAEYQDKINKIKDELNYPMNINVLGVTFFQISRSAECLKIHILGAYVVKIRSVGLCRKIYLLGIPFLSEDKTKLRILGITVREKILDERVSSGGRTTRYFGGIFKKIKSVHSKKYYLLGVQVWHKKR
jgi:glycosyltransferase involved in cell wall biosynthesis